MTQLLLSLYEQTYTVSTFSLWGRFGLRPYTSKATVCRKPEELIKLFYKTDTQVSSVSELSPDSLLVIHHAVKQTAKPLPNTSLGVACTTTAVSSNITIPRTNITKTYLCILRPPEWSYRRLWKPFIQQTYYIVIR